MNRLIAAAFVSAMMMAGANAMPLAPLAQAPNADIIEVAGGCGPGWHRGPYGGCRRNYARPGAARLSARLVPRPLRPLPRQRKVKFYHRTISHHVRRAGRSAVSCWRANNL